MKKLLTILFVMVGLISLGSHSAFASDKYVHHMTFFFSDNTQERYLIRNAGGVYHTTFEVSKANGMWTFSTSSITEKGYKEDVKEQGKLVGWINNHPNVLISYDHNDNTYDTFTRVYAESHGDNKLYVCKIIGS